MCVCVCVLDYQTLQTSLLLLTPAACPMADLLCRRAFLLEEFGQERQEDARGDKEDEHEHAHHHRVDLHILVDV